MKSGGKTLGFLYLLLILFLIPVTIYRLSALQNKEDSKKLILSAVKVPAKQTLTQIPTQAPQRQLEQLVKKYLTNQEGKYGVVIKNLKTEENYYYNEDKKFNSASLYKLWVMVVAFQKIKDGAWNETEVLSSSVASLDETLSTTTPTPVPSGFTPTPSANEPQIINMKVQEAIEKMITVSDNYAVLLLASRSGSLPITKFLKDYGLQNSNFKQPPQTTAGDTAIFFEKLYKGEIVDQEYSKKMIDILKQQTLNDRIPKYLSSIEVAHKTGELFGSKHDGGIVYTEKGDYIIVVLSDTKDSNKAAENIANFSKAVYDYFTNL